MSGPSLSALRELFDLPADADARLIEDAQRQLDGAAAEIARESGLAAATQVQVGQVVNEILSASEQADTTTLVLEGWRCVADSIGTLHLTRENRR